MGNLDNSEKTKYRTEEEKKKLTNKLNIIEGQIRGIKQMIIDDRYCDDILIQISAIENSLKSFGTTILKKHIETCVVDNIKNDNLEIIDELITTIKRLK